MGRIWNCKRSTICKFFTHFLYKNELMFLHFQLLFTKTNENSPTEKQTTANQNYYFKNLRTLITIIRRTKKTYKILFTAVPQCHIPFWSYSFRQKNLILT